MFNLKESKLGFSLIEMMLLLLIISLMTAASVPILSKKHKKAPTKVFHGRYACFYNGDQLWEQQYSGENIIKNDPVSACTFIAPKKTNYFYVQIIGGGGGGAGVYSTNPNYWNTIRVANQNKYVAQYSVDTSTSKTNKVTNVCCYSKIQHSLEMFDLTEEEFNSFVSTKYTWNEAYSGAGHHCQDEHSEDGTCPLCEGFKVKTGEFHCVDKDDFNIYHDDTYKNYEDCKAAGHEWKEDIYTTICPNSKIAQGAFAYTLPVQIKYGVGAGNYTNLSRVDAWAAGPSSTTLRNSLNSLSSQNLPRAKGGTGAKACIDTPDGDVCAEVVGAEGAELGECFTKTTEFDCVCRTPSQYVNPAAGYIAQGVATKPSSSTVCVEGDSDCLQSPANLNFYRREYYQTQSLPYGNGGLAGEYKTFFVRQIDADVVISPGKGGAPGAYSTSSYVSYCNYPETSSYASNPICSGRSGGDSRLGALVAKGGKGGTGNNAYYNTYTLPNKGSADYAKYNGSFSLNGDAGEISLFREESSMLNVSNPLAGTVDFENFGSGGQPIQIRNDCWEGYYYNKFEGGYPSSIEYKEQYPWDNVACKQAGSEHPWSGSTSLTYGSYAGYYRDAIKVVAEPDAGYSGAIIISW